ncbi:GNAT family N-acetyltransferase [Pseudomonas sp. HR96]|uniref:GNAT family N-acetyltransferase n=1 Tax=Pseudomonas sp. HR96 TaxID=1027966 RepID=UPI002A75A567|nr:GNAT family N-acetyltransferase [Pseudomonas sp. HR96]WPP00918.1 GNAT family N-acetyltransferase [Pseudomonas sp. HR96]
MSKIIKVISDFDRLPLSCITELNTAANASFFYDVRFLRAAHHYPLLPILKAYYILAYQHSTLVGFTVVYSQSSPDPFGSLSRATNLNFNDDLVCLGHIMHSYDSEIIASTEQADVVRGDILKSIKALGTRLGAKYVGLINIANNELVSVGVSEGYQASFMWSRYFMDIACVDTVQDYIAGLPADGRREMNRQQRKFQNSHHRAQVQSLPVTDLAQIAELVCATSARHGTPDYYPPSVFKTFVETCADLIRIISVEEHDQILGVMVCFVHGMTLHIWAAGMSYDKTDFSPYSVCMLEAFRYAKQEGLTSIEIGRTNHKIKTRMGFKAKELFSLIASA